MFDLIVSSSFGTYAKGDRLSGDADALSALAAKYPYNVIRVAPATDPDLVTHILEPVPVPTTN